VTQSILLTFKLRNWKYKFSNTAALFMVWSIFLATYSETTQTSFCL